MFEYLSGIGHDHDSTWGRLPDCITVLLRGTLFLVEIHSGSFDLFAGIGEGVFGYDEFGVGEGGWDP